MPLPSSPKIFGIFLSNTLVFPLNQVKHFPIAISYQLSCTLYNY